MSLDITLGTATPARPLAPQKAGSKVALWAIPLGLVGLGTMWFLFTGRGRKATKPEDQAPEGAQTGEQREAQEARAQLMREMGRKGGQKSAEKRRKKAEASADA